MDMLQGPLYEPSVDDHIMTETKAWNVSYLEFKCHKVPLFCCTLEAKSGTHSKKNRDKLQRCKLNMYIIQGRR